MRTLLLFFALFVGIAYAQRQLSLPDGNSCANRVRHDTRNGHNYFFSWEHGKTRNVQVDWLDARNICRRHCMDLVSIETPDENNYIKNRIANGRIHSVWTSGRKCNFSGCQHRFDLQPNLIKGWFWSGSGARIGPANVRGNGDWSDTGAAGRAQPDNRAIGNGDDEACIAILNNQYNDGVKWHDEACNSNRHFICEDSNELLNYARNRG